MRCLLVDDEPGIREGLAALLRQRGHEVRTAADCAGARAALADDFDVVVTDWRLPDGVAACYLATARCPIVAVSGHPEEVERLPGVCQVMTKPVAPSRLLEAIAAAAGGPGAPVAPPPLPVDVQAAVDAFLRQLPADAAVEMHDDGTFVTVRATLPTAMRPPLALPDGEVAWTVRAGGGRLQLRLHRDGRPAKAMPVVRPAGEWPATGEFAVDFHDSGTSGPTFLRCLDAAGRVRAAGGRVHFLNVAPALRDFATGHGRAHDMPMRAAVGPRLPAELADLWSDP